MRIGTWNLEGRWSEEHARLMQSWDCDRVLLTEVPTVATLPGYDLHRTVAWMQRGRVWSAVASRTPAQRLADPRPASSLVRIDGLVACSSVLPWPLWRPTGDDDPWEGRQSQRMRTTCGVLQAAFEVTLGDASSGSGLIWGGDWNTPLEGSLAGFDRGAQEAVLAVVDALDLHVPTRSLPSGSGASIDHIAIPRAWSVRDVRHEVVERGLSDHWAYVVDVDRRPLGDV